MTARKVDVNGYVRIKGNPISKVGVFPYLGSSLGADYIQDKIYNVYRPESSLNNPETIDSFKSIPWVDEHAMLGSEQNGLTPAEEKGIHGVTGDDVYFEYPYLKANLNIFSEHLDDIIEDGKNELSPGYRCKYEKKSGVFEGHQFDVIQLDILGNHLATVIEGRTGPDVAVMDHNFTFTIDSKDLIMDGKNKPDTNKAAEDGAEEMSMKDAMGMLKDMMPMMKDMQDMMAGMNGTPSHGVEDEDPDKDEEDMAKDADMCEDEDKEKSSGMDANDIRKMIKQEIKIALDAALKPLTDKVGGIESKAMDAALVETRADLVSKISARVGSFDHAEKSLEEIQDYGLEKFGLDCSDSTQKSAMLNGYFAANKPSQTYAADATVKSTGIFAKHLNKDA